MRPENCSEDNGNDADDNFQGDTIVKEVAMRIALMLMLNEFELDLC